MSIWISSVWIHAKTQAISIFFTMTPCLDFFNWILETMFLSIHVVFHRSPKFDKIHQWPLGYIYMSIIQTCRRHTLLLALCAEIRHVVSMGKLSKHIWVADGIRRPKPHVTTTTYWCMRNEEMGTKKPGYVLSLNLCMYASAYTYSSQIYIQKSYIDDCVLGLWEPKSYHSHRQSANDTTNLVAKQLPRSLDVASLKKRISAGPSSPNTCSWNIWKPCDVLCHLGHMGKEDKKGSQVVKTQASGSGPLVLTWFGFILIMDK